jgi:sulfofructose kinase
MVDAQGERIIVNYPSPDLLPDADWLNEIDFSQWDVVLADVRWHEGQSRRLRWRVGQGDDRTGW